MESTTQTVENGSDDTTRRTAHRNDLAHAATEKTRKRARWEALRLAPCPGARRINVANESHADLTAHTHTVTVGADGVPADCTCPAATYQPGPCKHAVACAGDHDALTSAMTTDDNHETDADADNHETETATDAPTATAPVTMADKLRADGRLVATDGGRVEVRR